MNNLKTEYCTLAFDDAINGTSTNAARIAEIISEYKAKQAEYDKYYAEYTASAYEKINAAYARLEAGEDFKAVMADVTENTDFTEIDAYADGMLISIPTLPLPIGHRPLRMPLPSFPLASTARCSRTPTGCT